MTFRKLRENNRTYYEIPETCFISKPKFDTKLNSYQWDGISVFTSVTKGKGIKATQPLPKGFLIPYGGVHVTNQNEVNKLCRSNQKNDFSSYLIVSKYDENENPIAYLDAHPRHYPPNVGNHSWIGSLVNEPSVGEMPNSKLVWCDEDQIKPPKYPFMSSKMNVFVELTKDINQGVEIVTDYGYSKKICMQLKYESFKYPKKSDVEKRPTLYRTSKSIDYIVFNDNGKRMHKI